MPDPQMTVSSRGGPLLCAGLCTIYTALFWFTLREMVDDAYISFRYADNLAAGHGPTFNPGMAPVEGYSNPLWVALLAIQKLTFGFGTPRTGLAFAWLAGLGTLIALYRAAPLVGLNGAVERNLPGLLVAVNIAFVALGQMALETVLFSCLLVIALTRWCREREDAQLVPQAWVWLLAVALTRPEGALFALGVTLYGLLWPAHPASGERRRGRVIAVLGFLLPFAVYHIARYAYFEQWLPNPFYAKVPVGRMDTAQRGLRYVLGFLLTHDGMYHTVTSLRLGWKWLLLIPVVIAIIRRPTPATLPLGASVAGYVVFIILAGGDWMPFHRFFGHILPLVALLAARGIVLLTPSVAAVGAAAHRGVGIGIVSAILLGQTGEGFARDHPWLTNWRAEVGALLTTPDVWWRDALQRLHHTDTDFHRFGLWLSNRYPPDTLATTDAVGVLPYYSGFAFIDTLGLVDAQIAQHLYVGDVEGARDAVLAREPDVIFNDIFVRGGGRNLGITSVDRAVLQSDAYARWYRITDVFVRAFGGTESTMLYIVISERLAEPEVETPVPFLDQFEAYLDAPGAERWEDAVARLSRGALD